MSPSTNRSLGRTAIDLREAFDTVFGAPRAEPARGGRRYLRVRFGDRAFAVRLERLVGIRSDLAIVVPPGADPHLLGVVSWRGEIVPVISLTRWLGIGTESSAAWVVRVRGEEAWAFGVDAVSGVSLEPPGSEVGARDEEGVGQRLADGTGVIDLDDMERRLEARAGARPGRDRR